jgi:hypothetical protein
MVTMGQADQTQTPFAVTAPNASDVQVAERFHSPLGPVVTLTSPHFQLAALAQHPPPTAWLSTHKLSKGFSN